jgi:hypothetical protein
MQAEANAQAEAAELSRLVKVQDGPRRRLKIGMREAARELAASQQREGRLRLDNQMCCRLRVPQHSVPAVSVQVHCRHATGRTHCMHNKSYKCHAVPALQLLVEQLAITAAKAWEKDRQLAELEDDLAAGDAPHWQAGIA